MEKIRMLSALAAIKKPLVLVIGTFDGLHIGHQQLLARAKECAATQGANVVVMSFQPHPLMIVAPQKAPALLMSEEEKERQLQALGVDFWLPLSFDKKVASMEPEEFIGELSRAASQLISIITGPSWRFGYRGRGDLSLLRAIGEDQGFEVEAVDPCLISGQVVSSTRIREALARGDLKEVEQCLGHPFTILSRVVRGKGVGSKKLEIPTCNFAPDAWIGRALPSIAVYATTVLFEGRQYASITNIGRRPTVESSANPPLSIETHLLDFSGDLYDHSIEVAFLEKIRDEKKFDSLEELKQQLLEDRKWRRSLV